MTRGISAILCVLVVCSGVYSCSIAKSLPETVGAGWGGADSVELTEATWSSKVENAEQNWLVVFFSPNCGYCKSLKPEWAKAAKSLKGSNVNVGHIDGSKNSQVRSKYPKVDGYPTILFFSKEDKEGNNEYTGAQKSQQIASWAKQQATA